MKFSPPLLAATLQKRYKRFLADVVLADGTELTVHCPNTGAMTNCCDAGAEVWLSLSNNPKRKYPHTWELVSVQQRYWAGVNTHRANKLVIEAIENGVINELQGYGQLQTEVKYGEENSRIDLLLSQLDAALKCYVEVKSVTLLSVDTPSLGLFPDAVSARGSKHLRELLLMKQQGHRAVLIFCVQHTGIEWVEPADTIDPAYGQALREAMAGGVEVYAYRAEISQDEITLATAIPVVTG